MHKIITITLLFSSFQTCLFAQSLQDRIWVLGYPALIPGNENNEDFGGEYLHFTDDTVSIEKFNIWGGPISATANGEDGNLLFYTNGCSVFNNQHQVMENGDGINFDSYRSQIECSMHKGYAFINNSVCLPRPETKDSFTLFYLNLINFSDSSSIFPNLLYCNINTEGSNGQGSVEQKHEVVLSDSLVDAIAVTRHGNGRDWWIIVPRGTNRSFWKLRYGPDGIEEKSLQILPPPYSPYTATFSYSIDEPPWYVYFQQDEYQFESWGGQANFSPDGTKYCRVVKSGDVEIYDFDRCNGELTLRRLIPLPPYKDYPEIPLKCCGVAISPNNRYLYFNNNEGLFQFDLCAENLEHGGYELIEYSNHYVDPNSIPSDFYQMRNGPDGKIYMVVASGFKSLHVIERPNEKGKLCRFKQQGLQLPRYTLWIINYFPNFNLYDLRDSPCDTLGIDGSEAPEPITFDALKVFPNPADKEVKVFVPVCEGGNIKVWNMAGQLVERFDNVEGNAVFRINTADWVAGMYVLEINIVDQGVTLTKLVVVH